MKEKETIEKTKEYLIKQNINFLTESLNYSYLKNGKLRNNETKSIYIISFLRTYEDENFDNDLCFLFIDSKTDEFLYIMNSHGYIEIEK